MEGFEKEKAFFDKMKNDMIDSFISDLEKLKENPNVLTHGIDGGDFLKKKLDDIIQSDRKFIEYIATKKVIESQ